LAIELTKRIACALLLVPALALAQPQTPPVDPARFRVDPMPALDVKRERPRPVEGAVLLDLSYASPASGRVPATLVLPARPVKRGPAILFAHWGLGTRLEWIEEAT